MTLCPVESINPVPPLPPIHRYNSTIVDVNPALEGGKGADGVDQFVVGFRVYYPSGPYEDENGKFEGYGLDSTSK